MIGVETFQHSLFIWLLLFGIKIIVYISTKGVQPLYKALQICQNVYQIFKVPVGIERMTLYQKTHGLELKILKPIKREFYGLKSPFVSFLPKHKK